ncbi:MAG TPA: PadR family transcriptional regulator [Bryobacteraceae bacterium]|jgi:PadR family transcriptional regulator, regulatory protein PadR|nr:PadR family transcriptional regulator [Bryobacteraceae bacterium]
MERSKQHDERGEMMQGTLDMLILRTVLLAPAHGHTIAHAIEHASEDVLQVEHGSLYPALHRLEERGQIASFWGTSENNRRAKYYRITPAGRKQLAKERSRWDQIVNAIGRVLGPAVE